MKSLSHVRLLATPWTAAYQAPPSMGFSRQEYWSGVPLPSPSPRLKVDLKRICLQCRRPWFNSWVRKISWRKDKLPTPVLLGFPCGLAGKESACNVRDLGSVPGLGRSPGEEKGYALQYSGLENSMDCMVHWVTKSQTQLSNFHFTFKG